MLRLNFIAHQYTKDSFCKTSESFVSQSLPFCTLCHSFLLSRFEFNPNVGGGSDTERQYDSAGFELEEEQADGLAETQSVPCRLLKGIIQDLQRMAAREIQGLLCRQKR